MRILRQPSILYLAFKGVRRGYIHYDLKRRGGHHFFLLFFQTIMMDTIQLTRIDTMNKSILTVLYTISKSGGLSEWEERLQNLHWIFPETLIMPLC